MPLLLIVFTLLGLLALAALVWLLWRGAAGNGKAATAEGEGGIAALRVVERLRLMRLAFKEALGTLEAGVGQRGSRYRLPWFLCLGAPGSGKTTLLEGCGLDLPFGKPELLEPGRRQGCQWWLFSHGAVLDVDGELMTGADGTPGDDIGWKALLHHLNNQRPRRPVDGVILALPFAVLTEGAETLAIWMETYYGRLWELQRDVGMRLPVYVVVTQCDQVSGFSAFCQSLPAARRGDIFGWSNPFQLDAAFNEGWVSEAFAGLERDLLRDQMDILAVGGVDAGRAEAVFLFARAFRRLEQPLQAALGQLFKQSAYHDSFLFRGLYFSGRCVGGEEGPAMAFIDELLKSKVFPERGLARPTGRGLRARNNALAAVQGGIAATLLLGAAGLWWADHSLGLAEQDLLPVMRRIVDDHQRAQRVQQTTGALATFDLGEEDVIDLLRGMEKINADHFSSVFLPASWFSSIDEDIKSALTEAFERIIFQSMHDALSVRVTDIMAQARTSGVADGRYPALDSPEFQSFKTLVEQLGEFERNAAKYNWLANPANAADEQVGKESLARLGELVDYLFGVKLPPEFFQNAKYYQQALAASQATQFPLESHTVPVRQALREAADRFRRRSFDLNPAAEAVRQLAAQTNRLAGAAGGQSVSIDLRHIHDLIGESRRLLDAPQYDWLVTPGFNPGPAFTQALAGIDRLALAEPGFASQLQEESDRRLRALQQELKGLRTSLTGSVLVERDGRLTLAPAFDGLGQALAAAVELPFMKSAEPVELPVAPAGHRLRWNLSVLENGKELSDAYERFSNDVLVRLEPGMRQAVAAVASRHLEAHLRTWVSRAEEFELVGQGGSNETALEREAANFREAAGYFRRFVSQLDSLGLVGLREALVEVTGEQAYSLLEEVDVLLGRERLYLPVDGDFSGWDGVEPASPRAFGAQDTVELRYVLDFKRQRVLRLARNHAAPVIEYLTAVGKRGDDARRVGLLSRWQRILSQLDAYENRQNGNSIAALERFILFGMSEIRTGGCTAGPIENGGDYFLEQQANLKALLAHRCRTLELRQSIDDYRQVADYFNETLAGRAPFSRDFRAEPVEPASLRRFFDLWDHANPPSERLASYAEVDGFLATMQRARAFFGPLLASDSAMDAGYDFTVDFRVNREGERNANQVIAWELQVGEQRIAERDATRRGRWRPGQPVQLRLRWAKDAPTAPLAGGDGKHARVEDRVVVFDYPGRWSLLELVQDYAVNVEAVANQGVRDPHLLRIDIPLDGAGSEPPFARVFVQLRIMPPGEERRLSLPKLPERAPYIDLNRTVQRVFER